MSVFLPKERRVVKHTTLASCYWCASRKKKKNMFKLVSGPVWFYFCDIEHALEWSDYRHNPDTHALLMQAPRGRTTRGATAVKKFCTQAA
jgi:hypothetical protein